jgi:hypothetical protein
MCHVVPIANAVATTIWWRKSRSPQVAQLNLMFYGASIFGFIDHLWKGELFLVSPNIGKDLFLGVVITACVWAVWGAGLLCERLIRRKAFVSVGA